MGNAIGDQTKKDSEEIRKQKILESRNGYIHEKGKMDEEAGPYEAEMADENTESKLWWNRQFSFCVEKKYVRCFLDVKHIWYSEQRLLQKYSASRKKRYLLNCTGLLIFETKRQEG